MKNVVDRETLWQLYVVENLPLKIIGKRYGVSKSVIKRLVNEFKLLRARDNISKSELKELYNSGLSTAEIGNIYSCSDVFIGNLLRKHGIEARRNRNQAGIKPDPELLRELYWNQWLSYEQIAERLGVDFTSVSYWLKKFQIPTRTSWESRRGKDWQPPDDQVIAHLYLVENFGTQSIAGIFGLSKRNVGQILERMDIKLRKPGYPNAIHYTAKDGHKVKSGLEQQVDNWLYENCIQHTYEPSIGDTKYKADFLAGGIYIEIWGIRGNQKYEDKRQKKLEAYSRLNLPVISVFPNDFPHLSVLELLTQ